MAVKKKKKKKKIASAAAIKSVNMKIIDPVRQAALKFINSYKGKIMYLRFNQFCLIKVKIVELVDTVNKIFPFECIKCKVIQKTPKWLKDLKSGTITDDSGKRIEVSLIRKGKYLIVNHLSLVDRDKVNDIVDYMLDEKKQNHIAISSSLKYLNESINCLESIKEYILPEIEEKKEGAKIGTNRPNTIPKKKKAGTNKSKK